MATAGNETGTLRCLDVTETSEINTSSLFCCSSSEAESQEVEAIPEETQKRMMAAKDILEKKIARSKEYEAEKKDRRGQLERKMSDMNLSLENRQKARDQLYQEELKVKRIETQRVNVNHFESLAILGRGGYGEVRLVRQKSDGEVYALKSMDKHAMVVKNQVAHVVSERNFLAQADNPWITNLFATFQDESMLYMVMEFLPGGDLMELLIKEDIFSEAVTKIYMAELSMAVQHVHSLGYIHRDIKPDNILIDLRGHLKLTDLGLCKKLGAEDRDSEKSKSQAVGHSKAYSVVGTPDYIAPEVLLQDGYGKEADLWSMGVIMYECLVGYTPFHDSNIITTCKNIVQWRDFLRFPADKMQHLSAECRDCMEALLCDSPERIGSSGQIDEFMQHKWFEGLDWEHLRDGKGPFVPDICDTLEDLLGAIKVLQYGTDDFKAVLAQILTHFPEAPNTPLQSTRPQLRHRNKDFSGYTYRRTPKVKVPLVDDDSTKKK